MKKISMVIGFLVTLGLVFSSPVYGAEKKAKEGNKGKAACTECDGLKGKITEKKTAIEGLKGQIKTAKDAAKAKHEAEKAKKDAEKAAKKAERDAKLEALKKSNPEKYAKLMEKQAGKKKDGDKKEGEKKGEKKEHAKLTPEQKAAKLEKMKTKNPEMFNLMSQRAKLQGEMKGFKEELKVCTTACKGKKG